MSSQDLSLAEPRLEKRTKVKCGSRRSSATLSHKNSQEHLVVQKKNESELSKEKKKSRVWTTCVKCGSKHWNDSLCPATIIETAQPIVDIAEMRRKWTGTSTAALVDILRNRHVKARLKMEGSNGPQANQRVSLNNQENLTGHTFTECMYVSCKPIYLWFRVII